MRPTKSLAIIETVRKSDLSDEELAYLQTQKALKEALSEQRVLKDRLRTLEIRNKPGKWGEPVVIQSFDTVRNEGDSNTMSPERLEKELKTALHMLENARRATETAKIELKNLHEEIESFKKTSKEESETVNMLNVKYHREESIKAQAIFNDMKMKWTNDKSVLLSEAERISMISHEALHRASKLREQVEGQRKKIQNLATEYRTELSKSKELRELLDGNKTKVNLTNTLLSEIDANGRKSEILKKMLEEQKKVFGAVRISRVASEKLEDISTQIVDLTYQRENAEAKLKNTMRENDNLIEREVPLNESLNNAENEFKKVQMGVFVFEAEIRELKAEIQRVKPKAIEEGRKNINLQHVLKRKNMDATMRYLIIHSSEVNSPEKVATSIQSITEYFDSNTLPPLNTKNTR